MRCQANIKYDNRINLDPEKARLRPLHLASVDAKLQDKYFVGKKLNTGRNPSAKELLEAERVLNLHPLQRKAHPSAIPADVSKLDHINTYGSLPEYYVDQPFTCRQCGKHEIWKARDQKWYYEETKGHIDAIAVECHACRSRNKEGHHLK